MVQYAVSLLEKGELDQLDNLYGEIVATTFRGRPIRCKTLGQREYVRAIRRHTLTFGIGPAGTAKPIWRWRWPFPRSRARRLSALC